ncbi:hypothetical protein JCM21900_002147 [Sporobolomyces salmonicolor]
MSPVDPPPPPYFPSSPAGSPTSDSRTVCTPSSLLCLPLHLLLSVLSCLGLPALVFSVKPACRMLRLAASVVARSREDVRSGWAGGLRRAATAQKRRATTTGVAVWPRATSGEPSDERRAAAAAAAWAWAGAPPAWERRRVDPLRVVRTREEAVLDTYVAGLARVALRREESSLLVPAADECEHEDGTGPGPASDPTLERDVFAFLQPKARCEDLVIDRGRADGVVVDAGVVEGRSTGPRSSSGRGRIGGGPVEAVVRADDVRVELKPRSARLLLPLRSSRSTTGTVVWKGVAQVQRGEADGLEETAAALSAELRWVRLRRREDEEGRSWYELE